MQGQRRDIFGRFVSIEWEIFWSPDSCSFRKLASPVRRIEPAGTIRVDGKRGVGTRPMGLDFAGIFLTMGKPAY